MGLINKIIFKIYDGQLKSVEEKQKELIWDNEGNALFGPSTSSFFFK